jgi:hypothetical protein
VEYLGSISRKNLKEITREIFVGYFEEDFGDNIDHYILFVEIGGIFTLSCTCSCLTFAVKPKVQM